MKKCITSGLGSVLNAHTYLFEIPKIFLAVTDDTVSLHTKTKVSLLLLYVKARN